MSPRQEQSRSSFPAAITTEDVHEDEDDHVFEDPRGIDALNMEDTVRIPVNVWQPFLREHQPRRRTQSTPDEVGWLTSGYTAHQRGDSLTLNAYHNLLLNDTELREFERDIFELFMQLTLT